MPRALKLGTTFVLGLSLALVSPPSASAKSPSEDPVAKADSLAREGLELARSKRFKEASERFEAALKLNPRAVFAHNLARAYEELGDLTRAFDLFSQAVRLNSEYTYAREGRRRIGLLRKKLKATHARIRITSLPSEVDLTLVEEGGQKLDHLRTPHERWVRPGRLTIRARKLGFQEVIRTAEVSAGKTTTLELTLKPVPQKGYIDVSSSLKGVEVWADGKRLGRAPIQGHVVSAGSHRITLRLDDQVVYEQEVLVHPEKTFVVAYEGAMGGGSSEAEEIIAYSLLAVGGAVLLTGIGLHVAAADRMSDVLLYPQIDLSGLEPTDPGYDMWHLQKKTNDIEAAAAQSDAEGLETGAWLGYTLAVGALVTGAVLLAIMEDDNAPQSGANALPSMSIVPTLGVSAAGSTFGLSLSF